MPIFHRYRYRYRDRSRSRSRDNRDPTEYDWRVLAARVYNALSRRPLACTKPSTPFLPFFSVSLLLVLSASGARDCHRIPRWAANEGARVRVRVRTNGGVRCLGKGGPSMMVRRQTLLPKLAASATNLTGGSVAGKQEKAKPETQALLLPVLRLWPCRGKVKGGRKWPR